MKSENIYDLTGIGIGPFNLGLAALCEPIKEIKTIFFDQKPEFSWHEGMLIPGTTLQVSYLADLVTLADPSSKFSYLNFLRNQNRLIQFGIYEQNYISRSEYNRYCRWVAAHLPSLQFSSYVEEVKYDESLKLYRICYCDPVTKNTSSILTRNIVAGTGSYPFVPGHCAPRLSETVFHSADYLFNKKAVYKADRVLITGSGQSAAEIVYDLLQAGCGKKIMWITRSDRFYAMENHKLAFEMTSPDYTCFFYSLPHHTKNEMLRRQHTLYKGINPALLNSIYDRLYDQMIEGVTPQLKLYPGCELTDIKSGGSGRHLAVLKSITGKQKKMETDCIILATGYEYKIPGFFKGIRSYINWLSDETYAVNRDYSITADHKVFVQNAEMHTHGFNAPDLGFGCYRNAVILNKILGYECYPVDKKIAFQCFEPD